MSTRRLEFISFLCHRKCSVYTDQALDGYCYDLLENETIALSLKDLERTQKGISAIYSTIKQFKNSEKKDIAQNLLEASKNLLVRKMLRKFHQKFWMNIK